jgi:hypothetical protein
MQLSCEHHGLHYSVQALRARGKRAVALPRAFGLPAIDSGWTLCATSTASAAAASTMTTTMHDPTHRRLRQALRHDNDAHTGRFSHGRPAWPRRALRSHDHQRAPRKPNVHPNILPRCYAPAASRQSPYLTHSGCKLLSQGRPGVRLARHQRRRQALRRQLGISGVGRHCDDNDSQPGTSAAATSSTNTTMHNPAAFHTAGVTATCATLARASTRTTKAKRSCSRIFPPLPSISLPATY